MGIPFEGPTLLLDLRVIKLLMKKLHIETRSTSIDHGKGAKVDHFAVAEHSRE